MKYCSKCGRELFDEAVICPDCGNEIDAGQQAPVSAADSSKENHKKVILISVISVIALAAIAISAHSLINHIRAERVRDQLVGKRFSHYEHSYFSDRETEEEYYFISDTECEKTYFYSPRMDEPCTYTGSYEIEFEDGMTFIVFYVDKLEVQYDRYGEIESLCDVTWKDIYD